MQNCYIKSIANEQWDDYQLRCIALGGNVELFKVCKEYKIEKLPLKDKSKHEAVLWYKKMF